MATNLGNHCFGPDFPNGLSSPAATKVTAMTTAGVWFQEEGDISGTDTDVVNILVDGGGAQGLLLRVYRSLENQRLMANFSFHMVHDGTVSKLRCFPRQLAAHMTLQQACINSGISTGTFPSEDWSSSGASQYIQDLNDALKPLFMTVYRA